MSEFLFISSPSANGERTRVRMNDIPRLFSEGLEEPDMPAPYPWESVRQRFQATVAKALSRLKAGLAQKPAVCDPQVLAPRPGEMPSWQRFEI